MKGNLSTRPFYNERLVATGLLLAAMVAIGLTAFNVSQFMSLSERRARRSDRVTHVPRQPQSAC